MKEGAWRIGGLGRNSEQQISRRFTNNIRSVVDFEVSVDEVTRFWAFNQSSVFLTAKGKEVFGSEDQIFASLTPNSVVRISDKSKFTILESSS